VPDEDYGERLVAFVVPQQNAAIEEASIREFLKDRVSRFEQPRDIKIVEKIPRNPAGKIVRNELTP
jgi:acyl-CoA synthetase (AMP-forming)/AMP-acid ligase II